MHKRYCWPVVLSGVLSCTLLAIPALADETRLLTSKGEGTNLIFNGQEKRKDLAGECHFIGVRQKNAVIAIISVRDAPSTLAFRGATITLTASIDGREKKKVKELNITGALEKGIPSVIWLEGDADFLAAILEADKTTDMGFGGRSVHLPVTVELRNVIVK